MSDYLLSLDEMKQVDGYLARGFKVHSVRENLSGMFVEFKRQEEEVCLQITTAEARKYFAAKLLEQTPN
jgi:crotonobetainyl-CoA:carnitine CoA-transferase CaiB-like acyl-CoA transferase